MKQILPIIIFFIFITCFPISSLGATVELSVDITSFRIPERSVVITPDTVHIDDMPNTEFSTCSGARIFLTDKSNSYIAKSYLSTDAFSSGNYCLVKGARGVLTFNYNALLAPYKVYAEINVGKQQYEETGFKPNCSPQILVTGGVAWYQLLDPLMYYESHGNYAVAECPNSYCATEECNGTGNTDGTKRSMIFSATHVIGYNDKNIIICGNTASTCSNVGEDVGVTQYFWGSPLFHTYQF
ncbi:MAG: hypothetical protein WCK10_00920 [Candidatus Staskawiczbacteria bacterium]